MAAWTIRSSRASVVSPGTISRRQIGGSVSISVTVTWYVRGGSSFRLAAEVRGMGAILPQTTPSGAAARPDPDLAPPTPGRPLLLVLVSVSARLLRDPSPTLGASGGRGRRLAPRGRPR
jgi:hypothetical protein